MGISTVASYTGAQIFEALGLSQELVDRYFTGTTSKLGGVGLDVIAEEVAPPARARPTRATASRRRTASSRSAASTSGAARASRTCSTRRPCSGCSTPPAPGATTSSSSTPQRVDEQSERLMTLRGLFRFKDASDRASRSRSTRSSRSAAIVKRFSTGAMSYGSICQEAHETLAIAMNRLGGKSNTGEGGEDADRLLRPRAPQRDQAGRVRPVRRDREYLTNADDIQIKMAQGAKPGEGGQLPGHKVYPWIAQDPALHARASA